MRRGAADSNMSITAYIVDDEPLAVERLRHLLEETGRVVIVGSSTSPQTAVHFLDANPVDVLFLDISMPGMTGFDLLSKLTLQPSIVFTTAYDEYALKAFEVNSIDYLLKPIDPAHLDRALSKVERLRGGASPIAPNTDDIRRLLDTIAASLRQTNADYLDRIASRIGDRVCFIEVERVSHFYAEDRLTYAAADGRTYCVDHTIADLEHRLNPRQFIRIHRGTLVNLKWVKEIAHTFGGTLVVRLKDAKRTELTVARNRVHEVKARLGL